MVQGMSTRKGTVVFLDEIIKEAGNVMHEQMMKNKEKYKAVVDPEETALEIGITGVKIQDMAAKSPPPPYTPPTSPPKLTHATSHSSWEEEKAQAKMFLYKCVREVLAGSMRLLSLRPLERM
ncbi:hypothetical protein CVT25_010253 [Psilocybe cyanescens]|uniref:Arginyl-tRNA synthetase catalytic core domain-containing protein n=1 Tax=Psilocybe cyanescens TaxID=93625 RepID=A0A409XDN0_PSICY|nr:hypothetical protein CVT25_010253 [Psilocybe cyanescens]